MKEKSNNKSIIQNVIALFFRMAVTMCITLYSVRLLLDVLGLEDYGVYTLVAGFVSMMGFLSNSMSIAIQRFYSFALGKNKREELSNIFSISTLIFFFIGLSLLLLSETVGLWFVKNKLVIPAESYNAAIWLYHFSIISFCVSIFRIPYIAVLLANEDMKLFAALNIMESCLKLGAVIILPFFSVNYLFLYGLFLLIISGISLFAHYFFTVKNYKEAKYKYYYNKKLFKSILSFSGWSLFGLLAGIGNNQGNNILINIFFGPVLNAAREIAVQIQNAVLAFSNSVYVAFKPQLIKSYAEENFNYMMGLFYSGTKAIFFLNLLLCIPLYMNTKFILDLWLTEVTAEMIIFTKLSLVYISVYSLNNPITTLVQATGKIKNYALIIETTILLSLPLTYILYMAGLPAQATFWVSILLFIVAHIIRLVMLKRLIPFSIEGYFTKFLLPALLILFLVVFLGRLFNFLFDNYFNLNSTMQVVLNTFLILFVIFIASFKIGLTHSERSSIKIMFSKYLPFLKS
jgi:O-antigen/teichoic acid export membrane protein